MKFNCPEIENSQSLEATVGLPFASPTSTLNPMLTPETTTVYQNKIKDM